MVFKTPSSSNPATTPWSKEELEQEMEPFQKWLPWVSNSCPVAQVLLLLQPYLGDQEVLTQLWRDKSGRDFTASSLQRGRIHHPAHVLKPPRVTVTAQGRFTQGSELCRHKPELWFHFLGLWDSYARTKPCSGAKLPVIFGLRTAGFLFLEPFREQSSWAKARKGFVFPVRLRASGMFQLL